MTSSDDRYTVIEFDNHGRRTFITEMVSLGLTTEPAPARRAKSKAKPKTEKAADKAVEKAAKPEKPAKPEKKPKSRK